MKTVKVRIAVAVDDKGNWSAFGNSYSTHLEMGSLAKAPIRYVEAQVHWLTAELPVPEPAEVAATVEEAERGK